MAFERQRPGRGDGPSKEESGGTPNPLDSASPDVDQARLAEAGVARGGSGDVEGERDVARAPDEVEGDAAIRGGRELDPSVAEGAEVSSAKPRSRLIAFLGHSRDELRRVQWPDRRQVGQATAVVLGFVVIAGGYLGLLDAIWKPLVNAVL